MIILGLVGPAGSGKDLFASILEEEHNFIVISFADVIKRFARKIFDFSSDSLWGPSQLRNEVIKVDESWWNKAEQKLLNYDINTDTGEAIRNELIHDVLTDDIREDGLKKLFSWFYYLRESFEEEISPRVILQTLGTEWGRRVDPNIWVNYVFKIIKDRETAETKIYSRMEGLIEANKEILNIFYPDKVTITKPIGIVIPDHRFLNEIKATQEAGGYVLRLNRLSLNTKESVGISNHTSESEMKTFTGDVFDLIVPLEEGIEKVYNSINAIVEKKAWRMKRDANSRLS